MIYSKACEYGIRALTHLARQPDQLSVVREVSDAEGIPHYFLGKILQTMAKEGLVLSTKGPGGGFKLAQPAETVTLYDIKAAIDGVDDLHECAVGLEQCNDQMPCPLHDTFAPLRQDIKAYLQETTLATMAEAVDRKHAVAQDGSAA